MNSESTRVAVVTGLAAIVVVCLALFVWLGVSGGGECAVGGLRIFSLSDPWKPLAVLALAIAGILWAMDVGSFRERVVSVKPASWVFLLVLLFFLHAAVSGYLYLHGDGREYVIQTQAMVLRQQLAIDPEPTREYWNATSPFDLKLAETQPPAEHLSQTAQAQGGFGGLYPDKNGSYRYYHAWTYSAVVAPFYALLHFVGRGGSLEYHSFRVVNVLFLALPFILAWRRRQSWPLLVVMMFVFVSPLVPYVDWQHPEIFCFALAVAAFQLVDVKRARWLAPILLGLAASQNVPLALFFPLHILYLFQRGGLGEKKSVLRAAASYGAGVLLTVLPMLYFRVSFGVWNVIEAIGLASFSNASASRAFHFLFSPLIGAIWFFPAAFLFLPASTRRSNAIFILCSLVSVFAVSWLSSSTANFNAGQIGCTRYAVWMLSPLFFIVLNGEWLPSRIRLNGRSAVFTIAVALNVAGILFFRTHELVDKDLRRFHGGWRAQPETAFLFRVLPYHDDAETVIENIVGEEVHSAAHFNKVFIWDLGKNRSLWIVPERALSETRFIRWRASGIPACETYPSNELLVTEGEDIVVYPAAVTNFAWHPIIGHYIELRMEQGAPDDIRADCAVVVRKNG